MIVLGLDIGGTKCSVIVADINDDSIKFLFKQSIPTVSDYKIVMHTLLCICEKCIEDFNIDNKTLKMGISCGGPLNPKTGDILNPPNLMQWNFNIVKLIKDYLGDCVNVKLMNDADACAVAEWKYGAGKNYNNLIFLTFGTGLGAGLILDGKLYQGTNGFAGEVGHIRLCDNGPVGYGKAGSFEGFCSGGGIRQIAIERAKQIAENGGKASYQNGNIEEITTKDVALSCENGNKDALEIMQYVGRHFGKGLSILIDLLNPEAIIAGSVFARAGKFMVEEMQNEINKEALEYAKNVCVVLPAKLGEQIGDYGAVVAALY